MSATATVTKRVDEYRLVRPLGKPEDGVFLAHDGKLDRAVVLHLLPTDPKARTALLGSARALARVTHPSLCRIHRIRERGEVPCIVQGFERGVRLESLARPLPPEKVRSLGSALAGALAALHVAGVAHGGVRADRVILSSSGTPRLIGLRSARPNADAKAIEADVYALLALLIELADGELRDSLSRLGANSDEPRSAEGLRRVLDLQLRPSHAPPGQAEADENPYRGLRPFEAAHAHLFFGRQVEVGEAIGRLRTAPWLLVSGPSGAGKSSLVRAGIVPAIAGGARGERDAWDVVTMVPGARPVSALAAALGHVLACSPDSLEACLRADPTLAGHLARSRAGRGLILVVDQLEEVIVLADASERSSFLTMLAGFGTLAPGVRAVLTLRSDFLDRIGSVDGVGTLPRDLLRATFVLPAMRADALRLAIVGPARARGFLMETPAMVEALATEGDPDAGGDALPLVSFVLAELWSLRDRVRHVLPEAALAQLGGVAGALARHGDIVLSTLTTKERRAARSVLLALVTSGGTRARRTREELVGAASGGGASEPASEAALEALIRGRLVVTGEMFELAHEALARAWPRLRGWLDEACDERAAAFRVAAAVADWERRGRPAEALWNERQLGELELVAEGSLPADAARFATESREALRRAKLRRWGWRFGLPVGALLAAASIVGAFMWSERRQTRAFVTARLAEAEVANRAVRTLDEQVAAARAEAFGRFDSGDAPGGEVRWKEALSLTRREWEALAAANVPLALALSRDSLDPRARASAADLTYLRILVAKRDHDLEVADDLLGRLAQLDDDGSRRARIAPRGHVWVSADPPGASVVLHTVRIDPDGRRVEDDGHATARGVSLELVPGSYVLVASAPGRYSTRYPLVMRRAQDEHVEILLPPSTDVPQGFVFVPAGESLVGSADADGMRTVLAAEPEHAVHVDAFLISEHEVTYGDYLEFLDALEAGERSDRRPRGVGLDLAYTRGEPILTLEGYSAHRGELFCRPERTVRRCQDWLRFPVAGISWDDGRAYVAWLMNARIPGARLCSEREWERAARGVDGRVYARGDALHSGDANFDETYFVDARQEGVDEVGSFATDRSPFGVLDMTGNVAEWVAGRDGGRAARGGNWRYGSFRARAAYRHVISDDRANTLGLRVCASISKIHP